MRIGESLAAARHRAGLTVAQVSEQTRIRETIIRGIEDDDFSACGGDFYTRGHIRSIAKAVGADPGPLIEEYDAVHRAPGVLSAVSLDELLTSERAAVEEGSPARVSWLRRLPGMAVLGARARSTSGAVRLQFTAPVRGRYVLIWFTRLPADSAGTFQASVNNVELDVQS